MALFELGLRKSASLAVQRGDPLGGHQAGLDGEGVDRLDQVVVGAGAHAFEDLSGWSRPVISTM